LNWAKINLTLTLKILQMKEHFVEKNVTFADLLYHIVETVIQNIV